jgi:hypothetical protein
LELMEKGGDLDEIEKACVIPASPHPVGRKR